jgi:hypothetical protein
MTLAFVFAFINLVHSENNGALVLRGSVSPQMSVRTSRKLGEYRFNFTGQEQTLKLISVHASSNDQTSLQISVESKNGGLLKDAGVSGRTYTPDLLREKNRYVLRALIHPEVRAPASILQEDKRLLSDTLTLSITVP